MENKPLGRVPKNRQPKERVTITKEEYIDLCNMRDFIYDNNEVMRFEMYMDVKNHMANANYIEQTAAGNPTWPDNLKKLN